jgi:hypothetical protein
MKIGKTIAAAVVLATVAGCGGDGADSTEGEITQNIVADSLSTGMPPMPMSGGMGQMAGMDTAMMRARWQQHMMMMQSASGNSLQEMMPMHRQMSTQMMEMMGAGAPRMGMVADSAWIATRDSLRRDLERMGSMSPEEMESFLEGHNVRMQRMLEMHGSGSPQDEQ